MLLSSRDDYGLQPGLFTVELPAFVVACSRRFHVHSAWSPEAARVIRWHVGHGAHAPTFSLLWVAGCLEVIGGLLIILGLFTRPVAFILCGEMAVAYFRVHARRGFWPVLNGGELAILYCFLWLYLVAAGAGPLSLDRFVRKRE